MTKGTVGKEMSMIRLSPHLDKLLSEKDSSRLARVEIRHKEKGRIAARLDPCVEISG